MACVGGADQRLCAVMDTCGADRRAQQRECAARRLRGGDPQLGLSQLVPSARWRRVRGCWGGGGGQQHASALHRGPQPIQPRAFCRCALHEGWYWCSQEGFLRFFPAWPLGEAASFRGLRASGAFLVNASIDTAGTVSGVSLRSEAGGRCEFLRPWAVAAAPKVVCGGAAVEDHMAATAQAENLRCTAGHG